MLVNLQSGCHRQMQAKVHIAATLWGIHGGRSWNADGTFLKKNQVTLGWEAMDDLRILAGYRQVFKSAVMAADPDEKKD